MIWHQTICNQIRQGEDISSDIEQEKLVIPVFKEDYFSIHAPIVEMKISAGIK
jgi:hypothetical protein